MQPMKLYLHWFTVQIRKTIIRCCCVGLTMTRLFIAPAQSFVEDMAEALYVVGVEGKPTVSGYCDGDLRGQAVLSGGSVIASAYGSMTLNNVAATYICKFSNMDKTIVTGGSDPENEALGDYTCSGLCLYTVFPMFTSVWLKP